MKKMLVTPMMILGLVCCFSPYSYAGSTPNSSSTGNATAVLHCINDEGTSIAVEHSHVAINTDACGCESYDAGNSSVDCDAGDVCTDCLASLQRGGLSVVSGNGYYDGDNSNELMHYVLTGNGGPFVTRFGCFCD